LTHNRRHFKHFTVSVPVLVPGELFLTLLTITQSGK
jgi:hypothetical protein